MTLRMAFRRWRRKFRLSSLLHNKRPLSGLRRSKMTAAQTNSALAEHITAFREHFDSVILPLWMGPGFNDTLGLPFESLDAAAAPGAAA